MAFFGLNFLGDYDVFGTAKAHKLERLTAVPESRFIEAFAELCMERTAPRLAREIQADGTALMLRGELPTLVTRVLGEHPGEEELNAFLTFFDITASGVIDLGEFTQGVRNMMRRAAAPSNPRGYTSHRKLMADRAKNKRPNVDPQSSYAKPVLASQECGWWSQQARVSELGVPQVYKPFKKTDVTLREGRSLRQYFGEM
jgi:hypothetical protein